MINSTHGSGAEEEPPESRAIPEDNGDTHDHVPFQIPSSGLPCFLDGKMMSLSVAGVAQ